MSDFSFPGSDAPVASHGCDSRSDRDGSRALPRPGVAPRNEGKDWNLPPGPSGVRILEVLLSLGEQEAIPRVIPGCHIANELEATRSGAEIGLAWRYRATDSAA